MYFIIVHYKQLKIIFINLCLIYYYQIACLLYVNLQKHNQNDCKMTMYMFWVIGKLVQACSPLYFTTQ